MGAEVDLRGAGGRMTEIFLIVDDSRLARIMAAGLIAERRSETSVVEAENADPGQEIAGHWLEPFLT